MNSWHLSKTQQNKHDILASDHWLGNWVRRRQTPHLQAFNKALSGCDIAAVKSSPSFSNLNSVYLFIGALMLSRPKRIDISVIIRKRKNSFLRWLIPTSNHLPGALDGEKICLPKGAGANPAPSARSSLATDVQRYPCTPLDVEVGDTTFPLWRNVRLIRLIYVMRGVTRGIRMTPD